MSDYKDKDYKIFDLFKNQWALVSAGDIDDFNACTVSFFSQEYQKALGYMGSHSGRNEDKTAVAGLTPLSVDNSVMFKEASMTFVCRKVYQHQFAKEEIAHDVQDYYKENPKVYPVDENGEWEPHWVYVGEIKEVKEN